VIRWKSWHRWTAICLLAYIYLAVAVALQREQDASPDLHAGLIPVTIPELLRLLRDNVIPPPRRDRAHRLHWSEWRRRHQYRERWQATAGNTSNRAKAPGSTSGRIWGEWPRVPGDNHRQTPPLTGPGG
jgi:hypothetical protein